MKFISLLFLLLAGNVDALESKTIHEVVEFRNDGLELKGELYRPEGKGPFPTVLYNHGSAPGMYNQVAAEKLGPVYVEHGWVFFMPYRRGQGLSQKAGPYIGDEIDTARKEHGEAEAALKMEELLFGAHLSDQLSALKWIKQQSFVDSNRIAVAGNSFGGIESVIGANKAPYCAAIAAACAGESWSHAPHLQKSLKEIVRTSQSPVFFFQSENDFDITPSEVLCREMKSAGKECEVKIYPPFGREAKDGHRFAYLGYRAWAGDVFKFLGSHCSANSTSRPKK